MDFPVKFLLPVSVIPAHQLHAHSSSIQSIGKCLISQIDRLNLNCYETSYKFPVKITNHISVSNQLLRSMNGIIVSNITISPHLSRLTKNEILDVLELAKFFAARDGCISYVIEHEWFTLAEREPIVQASIGYFVGHQAFVQKLHNAKHSNKPKVKNMHNYLLKPIKE